MVKATYEHEHNYDYYDDRIKYEFMRLSLLT